MSSMLLSAAAKTTVSVCVCAMPLVASAALLTFNGCCRSGAVSHSVAAQRNAARLRSQHRVKTASRLQQLRRLKQRCLHCCCFEGLLCLYACLALTCFACFARACCTLVPLLMILVREGLLNAFEESSDGNRRTVCSYGFNADDINHYLEENPSL